jgi:hypothetical protein
VFPVRYELNFYILFRRNSLYKGLIFIVKDSLPHNNIGTAMSFQNLDSVRA